MAYSVPDLPYDYDALEPHIDEQTMRVHHDKHHQAYVDKANAALEGTEWADADVDDVLRDLSSLPDDIQTPVRNNGGGHSNHTFFWQIMSPDGGGEPEGDLSGRDRRRLRRLRRLQGRAQERRRRIASAPAGRGWSATARAWRWSAPPTRTRRSPTARRRCWASTSGSTPTTSSTRTAARLHRRLVERGQLGRGGSAVRRLARSAGGSARRHRRPPIGRCGALALGHEGHRPLGQGGDREARVDAGVGRHRGRRRRPAGSRSRRPGCGRPRRRCSGSAPITAPPRMWAVVGMLRVDSVRPLCGMPPVRLANQRAACSAAGR